MPRLRQVLGEHVTQKGSLVAPDRLRFDFSHFQPISAGELATHRSAWSTTRSAATPRPKCTTWACRRRIDFGAMALFGEKYGEHVRVLKMGGFSTELCGGTHVHHTGDIGVFKILSEGGVAAGVRRIEAVDRARVPWHISTSKSAASTRPPTCSAARGDDVVDKLRQLLDRQKKLERELESFKAKAAAGATVRPGRHGHRHRRREAGRGATRGPGCQVPARRRGPPQGQAGRRRDRAGLGAKAARPPWSPACRAAALGKVKAGELLSHVAAQIGGKGGGRPDMAQGGGQDGPALVAALAGVQAWVGERLAEPVAAARCAGGLARSTIGSGRGWLRPRAVGTVPTDRCTDVSGGRPC